MLAPLENLISPIDAPVDSSRQSIFSETPASDFSRQVMVLDWIKISSSEGMPVGIGGDADEFFVMLVFPGVCQRWGNVQ
jgi:hypothetical protein